MKSHYEEVQEILAKSTSILNQTIVAMEEMSNKFPLRGSEQAAFMSAMRTAIARGANGKEVAEALREIDEFAQGQGKPPREQVPISAMALLRTPRNFV